MPPSDQDDRAVGDVVETHNKGIFEQLEKLGVYRASLDASAHAGLLRDDLTEHVAMRNTTISINLVEIEEVPSNNLTKGLQ